MDQAARIKQFIESMPVSTTLGIRVVSLGDGESQVEMDVLDAVTFDGHSVQGGLVATLADYAAVAACATTVETGWMVSTTGCHTHHILPARASRLTALGTALSSNPKHLVGRADVHLENADGAVCLAGTFTAIGLPPR